MNQFSVGIEMVNPGPLKKTSKGYISVEGGRAIPEDRVFTGKQARCSYEYWCTYPDKQVARVRELIRLLKARYPEIVDVVGHADVAPGRKLDPGPAFPWTDVT